MTYIVLKALLNSNQPTSRRLTNDATTTPRHHEASIARYRLLPHNHRLPTKSVVMSIAVSKVGIVPCRASSEKSKDSIGRISYYLSKC